VSALLPRPATAALNHVLRSAPLALERLQRHAGRTVAFHVGPTTLAFTIQTTGEVTAALPGASRDLEVRMSPFAEPRMQGDEALAQDVAFLVRHLRWDAEEDLARVVGDIPAHRAAGAARAFRDWARDARMRLAQGAAEYWTEEQPLIASRVKLESFIRDVSAFDDDLARLEARVERLGTSEPPPRSPQ
jgi:ubiquinone biosynthesis protein UbiJ